MHFIAHGPSHYLPRPRRRPLAPSFAHAGRNLADSRHDRNAHGFVPALLYRTIQEAPDRLRRGLEMNRRPIPDAGTDWTHSGVTNEPALTSPARLYLAMMTPLPEALVSVRAKPTWHRGCRIVTARTLAPVGAVVSASQRRSRSSDRRSSPCLCSHGRRGTRRRFHRVGCRPAHRSHPWSCIRRWWDGPGPFGSAPISASLSLGGLGFGAPAASACAGVSFERRV